MQIKGTKLAEGKPLTGEGRSAENSINLLQIYYVYGMVIYTTLIRKNLCGVVFCHDCESLSEKNIYIFPMKVSLAARDHIFMTSTWIRGIVLKLPYFAYSIGLN